MSLKSLPRNTDRQSVDHLSDLFRNLGNSLELEEVLATLDQELRQLIVYDALSVHLPEAGGFTLVYASRGELVWLQSSAGQSVLAGVAREHRPEVHMRRDGRGGSVLLFPIEGPGENARHVTAVLALHCHGENSFSDGELAILWAIAPKLASSIENAGKYRRAEQLAEADPLTGLANVRSLFRRLDAELERARRRQDTLAVFECSVEGFDRSGRLCSAAATRSAFEVIARKLREHCREYDFAARSGDELVLVLPGFRREFLADKQDMIARIIEEAGLSAGLPLFAALGEAFFPEDGKDAEDLLATAAQRVVLSRQHQARLSL